MAKRGRRAAEDTEVTEFNGLRYTRRPGKRYFKTNTWDKVNKKYVPRFLHRDVWIFYNGPIPEGHDIHHKDENWDNNDISNLECLSRTEHNRTHDSFAEWNKTEEARKLRERNVQKAWADAVYRDFVCEFCGNQFQSRNYTKVPKYCSAICGERSRLGGKPKECQVCHKQFWGRPGARTCSEECSVVFWTGTCAFCQKQYEKGRPQQEYCSKKCRFAHMRARPRVRPDGG